MRTFSAQITKLLSKPNRRADAVVEVKDSDGVWQNLSDVAGRDFVRSVSWDEDNDTQVGEATITVQRNRQYVSLAPLNELSKLNRNAAGAYAPLVDVGREVRIRVALLPAGGTLRASDLFLVWEGEIDDVEAGQDGDEEVSVVCRDLGCRLVDAWVESESTYGSAAGTPLETAMQNILDQWAHAPTTLHLDPVYGSPGYNLNEWKQESSSVMEVLEKLATSIGWLVRYRWNSSANAGAGGIVLTLFPPPREKTQADATILRGHVQASQKLRVSRADVRTVVRVVYQDKATGAVQFVERKATDVDPASTSITRFGRRFARFQESADSMIDSATEATTFCEAVLKDLMDPRAETQITLAYRPDLEIGDLLLLEKDGRAFTTDQTLAVVGLSHAFEGGDATTTVRLRGRPSGGYLRWLNREDKTFSVGHPPLNRSYLLKEDKASETWQVAGEVGNGGTTPLSARVEKVLGDGTAFVLQDWAATPYQLSFVRGVGMVERFRIRLRDGAGNEAEPLYVYVEPSAYGVANLVETWETERLWLARSGREGTPSFQAVGSAAGGKVLRLDGLSWYRFPQLFPFDPAKLYEFRFRVRQHTKVSGSAPEFYLGFDAYKADGTTFVDRDGLTNEDLAWYVAADKVAPAPSTTQWTEYVGYLKGYGAYSSAFVMANPGSNTASKPSGTHSDVRYFRPVVVANWGGVAGDIAEVDSVVVRELDEKAYAKRTKTIRISATAFRPKAGAAGEIHFANTYARPSKLATGTYALNASSTIPNELEVMTYPLSLPIGARITKFRMRGHVGQQNSTAAVEVWNFAELVSIVSETAEEQVAQQSFLDSTLAAGDHTLEAVISSTNSFALVKSDRMYAVKWQLAVYGDGTSTVEWAKAYWFEIEYEVDDGFVSI